MPEPRNRVFSPVVPALAVFICGILLATMALAVPLVQAPYSTLLRLYVHNGSVDYAGFKEDAKRLDSYLSLLAHVDPDDLSARDQKAFYINVYNAWTIKLVLLRYPKISSIKDAGSLFQSPWKIAMVKLGGKTVTLEYIENDILRPKFKDARVHFALNCASKSCPPLRPEPYDGNRLNEQLEDQVRTFISNPAFNRIEGQTLLLSKIFDWYAQDFGGTAGTLEFLRRYAGPELRKGLDTLGPSPKISYLDYDWSLNGK